VESKGILKVESKGILKVESKGWSWPKHNIFGKTAHADSNCGLKLSKKVSCKAATFPNEASKYTQKKSNKIFIFFKTKLHPKRFVLQITKSMK